ncbi:MAG: HPr family phosphocarrier protein [Bacteroidales bacterium]|nr:HPr family phosphocarrier protein [Bacteroidales bacterium]
MHARPAGVLAKTASAYQSTVNLHFQDKCINAKRMLAIMTLGLQQGDAIRIDIEGEDEIAATQALTKVLI